MAHATHGRSMPATIQFHDTELSIIDRDGRPWLTGPQIGGALGYPDGGKQVQKIYGRNRDEFTDDMTAVIPQGRTRVRIFSPRGCHLIAMFARTDRAKDFRRWVLDVLDRLEPGAVPVRPHVRRKPQPRNTMIEDLRAVQLDPRRRHLVWFDGHGKMHVREVGARACIVDGHDETNLHTFLREFVPVENLPMVFDLICQRMRVLACREVERRVK